MKPSPSNSDWRIAAGIVLVLGLSGCGGPYEASVSGVVRLDGQPVQRGTVVYYPAQEGPAVYGRINEDGSYVMRTGNDEGLPPGKYVVSVIANEPSAQQDTGGGPPPLGKAIVPTWYRSKATSGLVFQVQPGHNDIALELSSKRAVEGRSKR